MIATSHGVIWRNNPWQIVEKYALWADNYQENQITVVYDTMWNGTKMLAEHLAGGINAADPSLNVKLYNVAKTDQNDLVVEVFKSKLVVVGSQTVNRTILHSVAGFLHLLKRLKFQNKKAACFGCYGWSGESTKVLAELLHDAGFAVVDEGFKNLWNPNKDKLKEAALFGQKLVSEIDYSN